MTNGVKLMMVIDWHVLKWQSVKMMVVMNSLWMHTVQLQLKIIN